MNKKAVLLSVLLCFTLVGANQALAGGGHENGGNNECPVGLVNGMELDEEFGPGTSDLTRCLKRRHNVKVVMQINKFCRDAVDTNEDCTRPYALGNIRNMINDYEVTHGMVQGKDYEIVAVVHSGGGWQTLKDNPLLDADGNRVSGNNKFEGLVSNLIADGVKFYFCQNTTRGFITKGILQHGDATAELIDGVEYVTAGVTAIADFQDQGYRYVQP